MEDVDHMMIMTCSPQTYWWKRIDSVNLCDIDLLPHHQPEDCAQSDHILLGLSSLALPLKILSQNPTVSWDVLNTSCLGLLA